MTRFRMWPVVVAGLVLGCAAVALFLASGTVEYPVRCADAGLTIQDPSRASGPFSDGTIEVTVVVHRSSTHETLNWVTDRLVTEIVLEGGPMSNRYAYAEPRVADHDLRSTGDRITYVTFCYLTAEPTSPPAGATGPTSAPEGVAAVAPVAVAPPPTPATGLLDGQRPRTLAIIIGLAGALLLVAAGVRLARR